MRLPYVALALALSACAGCPPKPNPTPPDSAEDGGVFSLDCPGACGNMQRLACEIGKPTPAGVPCEDVCANAQANGIDFHTTCLARAVSCDAAKACSTR